MTQIEPRSNESTVNLSPVPLPSRNARLDGHIDFTNFVLAAPPLIEGEAARLVPWGPVSEVVVVVVVIESERACARGSKKEAYLATRSGSRTLSTYSQRARLPISCVLCASSAVRSFRMCVHV